MKGKPVQKHKECFLTCNSLSISTNNEKGNVKRTQQLAEEHNSCCECEYDIVHDQKIFQETISSNESKIDSSSIASNDKNTKKTDDN